MSPEYRAPRSGMRLGNYILTVKLGQGVFSETWLAEHSYLESKETCLKIFTNERICHHLRTQKFLPVVKAPKYLAHVEDYNPTSNPPYLAQELLSGKNLRQLLRERKKLSPQLTIRLIGKIAYALSKLHQKNIAHLDLRPEHIILEKTGYARLIDYPIGKVVTLTIAEYYREYSENSVKIPKPIMRLLVYKSKRQRTGFSFDQSADIFSLGMLIFEMTTGTYPSLQAGFPSDIDPTLPNKIDELYAHCCGKSDSVFQDVTEFLKFIKADIVKQAPKALPGIKPTSEQTAIISVFSLGGEKNYVDAKNLNTLSKNLDEIMTTKLRFIAFDFAKIDYLNSSAIGFLINFSDKVQGVGGDIFLFNVDEKVFTILSALGLENVITILSNDKDVERRLAEIANKRKKE